MEAPPINKKEPSDPSEATLKRLFARCQNRCAFPRCRVQIFDGKVLLGEVCHIKGAKPGSARYDPAQTAEQRHSYDNLIILCNNHHGVIDADVESYTVERLLKLKADQQNGSSPVPDDIANQAVFLLMENSVRSANQSGGITAGTVNIENYHATDTSEPTRTPSSNEFVPVVPKQGQARFRIKDQPLGVHWDQVPGHSEYEIFLNAGPAMWLRVMPQTKPNRTWSVIDLHKNALSHEVCLQPFLWTNLRYLRAEDGFGTYSVNGAIESESITESVAFAFESGETWIIDTTILRADPRGLNFVSTHALVRALQRCGIFLQSLGLTPPFNWVAGLEDIKGRIFRLPSPYSAFNSGRACLSEAVLASGAYDVQQSPGNALQSFFNQLFQKCGSEYPHALRLAVEK